MAQIICICGKIGSGKTTYAQKLIRTNPAVLLSCDEVMLALFGQYLGDRHEEIAEKTKQFLLQKALQILSCGLSVVLDWGFPTLSERNATHDFFLHRGYVCQWHYVRITDEIRFENIRRRNARVLSGDASAYYIDENIVQKLEGLFEEPRSHESMLLYDNHPPYMPEH